MGLGHKDLRIGLEVINRPKQLKKNKINNEIIILVIIKIKRTNTTANLRISGV